MNLLRLIEFFRRHLRTVVKLSLVIFAGMVLVDAIPTLVDKGPAHTPAERIPGFWAAFGFVACVLIIVVSKMFGRAGIMTREDYYDE